MRPELLTHPNIPKPLHGLNPRSILGQEWWDVQRQRAYAAYNYHCWSCGIHKRDAKYHQWLEAHESYVIDYRKGYAELKEIVALCHSCHNFIHSGRMLHMVKSKSMSEVKALDILEHGFRILKLHNLKPFIGAALLWLYIKGYDDFEIMTILEEKGFSLSDDDMADWEEWHLIIDGKKYFSLFNSYKDWAEHYSR